MVSLDDHAESLGIENHLLPPIRLQNCIFTSLCPALPALPLVRSDLRTLAIVGQGSTMLSRYIQGNVM